VNNIFSALVLPPSQALVRTPRATRVGECLVPQRSLPVVPNPWSLSPSEAEIMRLTIGGMCVKEVAAQLHISHKTVESHLSRVREKMGTRTRLQAFLAWDRHLRPHYVEPEVPDPEPGKRDIQRARLRAAAAVDQESRKDRGNRILLSNLRRCMPHWNGE
jgi:DNA-binding CsgD family transcriptional regulator